MRAITIMYDSLNRNYLPDYGDAMTIAPNFARLGERTVTFDNFYVGSLPCMPARRELHTGRYNFLHRCWGPLEPFDDSTAKILSDHGVYTHCVTDHCHYWQEGGASYLTKFSSCETIRGQEGDFWYGRADNFIRNYDIRRHDAINREYMPREEQHPHAGTFAAGMRFLKDNVDRDDWYLHIEYFDPHEPFFVPRKYKELYPGGAEAAFDWPGYGEIDPDSRQAGEAKLHYRALLSMMDNYLGKVLDFMDENGMWKDTLLIVNTDHGFLLGEHGYFAKNYMPSYDQLVRIPFFIWNPALGKAGERRANLAQTPDIAPTILEYFGLGKPGDMLGKSLWPVVADGADIHDHILFGYFGKHVNVTDGRYVYMRAGRSADENLLMNYTLLPLHMMIPFALEDLRKADKTLTADFSFTKGAPIMRIPASGATSPDNSCYQYEEHLKYGDLLFDLRTDPGQTAPLRDAGIEGRLIAAMKRLLSENEAPAELYERMGLPAP
ncbi:MAG: sulfatase-like hydrolase/transferase [Planctomycetota bacterium]|jgi:arylsulfatase A-like enzyme|nr:sulfatase-like hydrolase/transferase [Planctomycetota bacterium]